MDEYQQMASLCLLTISVALIATIWGGTYLRKGERTSWPAAGAALVPGVFVLLIFYFRSPVLGRLAGKLAAGSFLLWPVAAILCTAVPRCRPYLFYVGLFALPFATGFILMVLGFVFPG